MIDATTPIGEVRGYYRSTLLTALRLFEKTIEKVRKGEEEIDGETEHLDEREEVINHLRAAMGAPTSGDKTLEGTPIGRAMDDGARKHGDTLQADVFDATPDDLAPEGVNIHDDQVVVLMLELVSIPKEGAADDERARILAAVKTWDVATRTEVYRWSRAMQLSASDHDDVKIPPTPDVIKSLTGEPVTPVTPDTPYAPTPDASTPETPAPAAKKATRQRERNAEANGIKRGAKKAAKKGTETAVE